MQIVEQRNSAEFHSTAFMCRNASSLNNRSRPISEGSKSKGRYDTADFVLAVNGSIPC